MEREDYLDEIHVRILRVTEDLRSIQRQLNCAAMEAPSDPELMEALSQLPETGERLRQSIRQKVSADAVVSPEASFVEKFQNASDTALLRYLSDSKHRKPN